VTDHAGSPLPDNEPRTGQVAFVVDELIGAIDDWIRLGVGPWNIWTFDAHLLRTRTYGTSAGTFSARVALCSIGPLTYELIEPLDGPSIWHGFLERGRSRMHHLGYYVADIDHAISSMAEQGFHTVQSGAGFGVDGDGAFVYFDTLDTYGCYFEAIQGPRALPDPERVVSVAEGERFRSR
jgi:methylmalonyl-CoA/ethylmalonyl-CoA epimerase